MSVAMRELVGGVIETREETDASLNAEREAADVASECVAAAARRVLEDIVDRERLLADQQMVEFRAKADDLVALERQASPMRGAAMTLERRMADEDKEAERLLVDEALAQERHRTDVLASADQENSVTKGLEQQACREETDLKLGAERDRADAVEAALGQSEEALVSAAREQQRRRDVLAMVSHDLRAPLTVISASAGLIHESADNPVIRDLANDIERSAGRMARLLTDLLDFASIETGGLSVVKQKHDVGALLGEVLRSYWPLFSKRALTFTVNGPSVPVSASFDHDRVVQVLSNLLGNALKFTPAGGVVVLSAHSHRDHVEFEVRDNGLGIPAEALPRVFERFWQLDGHASRGLGLGLYICKQIIAAHGGEVGVQSVLGCGSTFRFTLPSS